MSNIDVTQSLIWQYNEAEKLQALIEKKQEWIDINHNQFWSDWYRDVFDLRTANDFGLSVWAILLGVDFGVIINEAEKPIFGYDPFGMNYFKGTYSAKAGAVQFTSEQRRLILQLRYFKLTSRCTVPEINFALKSLIGSSWSILDSGSMSLILVFSGIPVSRDIYVIENFDVIPRPSTVGISYRFNAANAFGYSPYGMNYNKAVYSPSA